MPLSGEGPLRRTFGDSVKHQYIMKGDVCHVDTSFYVKTFGMYKKMTLSRRVIGISKVYDAILPRGR